MCLGMFEAAEKSIVKGLGFATDFASKKVLLDLRSQVEEARRAVEGPGGSGGSGDNTAATAKASYAHLLPADILLLICEAGVRTDPGMGVRMAAVCKEWRAVMLSSRVGWSHLVLGTLRTRAKTTLWVERSGGRIKCIDIRTVPGPANTDVAQTLQPHISNTEELIIRSNDLVSHFDGWKGRLRVRTLRLIGRPVHCLPGDLELFAPGAEAKVECMDFIGRGGCPPGSLDCSTVFREDRFASLKVLRMYRGYLSPGWIADIACSAPQLRELVMVGETIDIRLRAGEYGPLGVEPATMTHLTRLELRDASGMRELFRELHTPSLQHLSLYDWKPTLSTVQHIRGPGLPRSQLVSLDVGSVALRQDEFLELLIDFKSLKFLNVSFCPLDNDFLEALVAGNDRTLLPSLVALSIAGNDSISAGPLRRMILSRLPVAKPTSRKPAPLPIRRSSFAPARIVATAKAAPSTPTTSSASATLQAAQMTWLNVDMCNNPAMDVDVLDSLRKRLSFLSNINTKNIDRLRGRGAFAWDAYTSPSPTESAVPAKRLGEQPPAFY